MADLSTASTITAGDGVDAASSLSSSSFYSEFFVPLVSAWVGLLVLDAVISALFSVFAENGGKKTGLSKDQTEEKAYGFFYGNGPIPFGDTVSLIWGAVMLLVMVPLVALVVGLSVLWDFIDRVGQGRPQDGLVMSAARWVNKVSANLTGKFTKSPEDGFILNVMWWLGLVIPITLFLNLNYTLTHGFSLPLCIAYHIFRIGPYFMSFAYCYTLCHKEGHSRLGFFKNPVVNFLFRNWFNWWVGLYFGVMPSSFAYGHSVNHHKYNNGPLDVVSTADKPRDSFTNFVRFLPRFFLYAINVSTIRQFLYQGEYKITWKMLMGTLFYLIWVGMFYRLSPVFALCYILYPLGENVVLLTCIQWCWHGFIDPENPENPFVGAITVLKGPINVLGEDFHVVHHQYPGAHWASHDAKYQKHLEQYKEENASGFQNTHAFEMFFLIILRKYREMAERFVDYSGKYPTLEAKEELIKTRLRACWWGPLATVQYKQHGWEGVQDSDGFQ